MSIQIHEHIRKLDAHPRTRDALTPEARSRASQIAVTVNKVLEVHQRKVAGSRRRSPPPLAPAPKEEEEEKEKVEEKPNEEEEEEESDEFEIPILSSIPPEPESESESETEEEDDEEVLIKPLTKAEKAQRASEKRIAKKKANKVENETDRFNLIMPKPDAALLAEALLNQAEYDPNAKIPVLTNRQKMATDKLIEKHHDAELELARLEWRRLELEQWNKENPAATEDERIDEIVTIMRNSKIAITLSNIMRSKKDDAARKDQQVYHERNKWLTEKRAEWLDAHPNASNAAAVSAITQKMAEKAIKSRTALLTDKLTAKEIKRVAQDEKGAAIREKDQRTKMHDTYVENLSEQQKKLRELQREKTLNLHMKWHLMQDSINHTIRRQQRVRQAGQMIRFRSKWWHDRALNFFKYGIMVVLRDGSTVPMVDPVTKAELINPVTKGKIPARYPPGQRMYMDIMVPQECIMDFAFEWNPSMETRVYSEDQARAQLFAHERIVADPTCSARERADREEGEVLLRNLVRDVAAYDPYTQFVYKITVCCMSLKPNEPPGTMNGPREFYEVGICSFDEQMDVARIATLGPLKKPHKICGNVKCDGYILVADNLIKSCGKCDDMCKADNALIADAARLKLLYGDEPEKKHEEDTEPTPEEIEKERLSHGPFTNLTFCCEACKNMHIRDTHENMQAAKKYAKRQREKANAKKRKAEAALILKEAALKEEEAQKASLAELEAKEKAKEEAEAAAAAVCNKDDDDATLQ